jgi:hypothetical protein
MTACKAIFQVTAGVIPGTAMPEYGKRWSYDSSDYEKDRVTPPDQETIFTKLLKEAHQYAIEITNPVYVNWVRVDWLWV